PRMRDCPQCGAKCDETHKFCPQCGFPIGKVQPSADDPLVGRTLPGGYVILELVGIGGMGRVYRAEQTNLGRTVPIKIIHPHLVGGENAAPRFITEAAASSRCAPVATSSRWSISGSRRCARTRRSRRSRARGSSAAPPST